MKKEIFIHFLVFILLFLLFSLLKGFLNLNSWTFWLGGLIGTVLPDIDHLIYVYFLNSHELDSQRAIYMTQKGQIWQTLNFLYITRSGRRDLIFHSVYFQILFLIFSFLIITSSSNLLGKGIVFGFLIHLAVDLTMDFLNIGSISHWFSKLNLVLDRNQETFYLIFNLGAIFVLGLLL